MGHGLKYTLDVFCINLVRLSTKSAYTLKTIDGLWDIVPAIAVKQTTVHSFKDRVCGVMQSQLDCEIYLARRLRAVWQARAVDRDTLAKSLILSPKQLEALEQGDPSSFHTYGIYLRAMRQALGQAQLLEDPEVLACLQRLVDDYTRKPPMSHVVQVKHTVNKQLGVAPQDAHPDRHPKRNGVYALVVCALVLLFSVVVISVSH